MDNQPETGTTETRIDRRGALRTGFGAVAGLFLAYRGSKGKPSVVHTEDYCYWKRYQGPNCTGHQLYEYQCEYCCGGGTCETVTCGWYITGTC